MNAAMAYASATWNCDGSSPPCVGCVQVPSGSTQSPYGCADWVAHVLAAGGFIPLDQCGDISLYGDVNGYDLNYVSSNSKDINGLGSSRLPFRFWTRRM